MFFTDYTIFTKDPEISANDLNHFLDTAYVRESISEN